MELGAKVGPLLQAYVSAMEAKRLREGLKCAIQLSALGNQFFQVGGGRVVNRVVLVCFRCVEQHGLYLGSKANGYAQRQWPFPS